MSILSRIFGTNSQDALVKQMTSAEPFAHVARCGCNCGQPLNDLPTETVEGKIFLENHCPTEWREYAAVKESERKAAAEVAARELREKARLNTYLSVAERLLTIKDNVKLLARCGLLVPDLIAQAEEELRAAEKFLSNEQRAGIGLPPRQDTASEVYVPRPQDINIGLTVGPANSFRV